MTTATVQPWDQRKGETDLWYGRFDVYRSLGTERSVKGAYEGVLGDTREKEDPHGGWYEACKRNDWEARARDWDNYCRTQSRRLEVWRATNAYRLKLRKLEILSDRLEDLDTHAANFEPGTREGSDYASALKIINAEIRAELDDLPTERHEHDLGADSWGDAISRSLGFPAVEP